MARINRNIAALPAGYLFAEIARRVREYEGQNPDARIIRLGIGDVTRPLSRHVAEAFAEAARGMASAEGFHGYAPDFGYPFLIDAILQNDYAPLGVTLRPGEVFVSDGAKTDSGALQELFAVDARIALTDPVYPVYVDSNAMAGRAGEYRDGRWSRITYLPCVAENGFVPPLPAVPVDLLYLCCPNNPTGTILTKEQLKMYVDWANDNGAVILFDAAYKSFIRTEGIPHSIYEIDGAKKCAIECCSFSKSAGFTGVRCAYTVIPEELVADGFSLNALWKRRTGSRQNGVSYPVQCAAAAVYAPGGREETLANTRYYQENAEIILSGLTSAGLSAYGGVDSPYIWMKTPRGMDSWSYFDLLLRKAQVVGTPGAGFGPCGERYFRLTAFNTHEATEEAVQRIAKVTV